MAKILILEDFEDVVAIYEDMLSSQHELLIVRSLDELKDFQKQNTHHIDLMLADLKLPDGFFLDWVMKSGEMMDQIPTIIVSSMEDEEILTSCFEWGAIDYLIKPFKRTDLTVKIAKALGQFDMSKVKKTQAEMGAILDELTSIEAKIFQQLINHPGCYISRDKITSQVWKKVSVNAKTLDVHLSNIRKKLAHTSWVIDFEDSKGWKLKKKDLEP